MVAYCEERQELIHLMLTEAISKLCKKNVPFASELCIQGIIGITMDKQRVMLLDIKETLSLAVPGSSVDDDAAPDTSNNNTPTDDNEQTSNHIDEIQPIATINRHRPVQYAKGTTEKGTVSLPVTPKRKRQKTMRYSPDLFGKKKTSVDHGADIVQVKEEPVDDDCNASETFYECTRKTPYINPKFDFIGTSNGKEEEYLFHYNSTADTPVNIQPFRPRRGRGRPRNRGIIEPVQTHFPYAMPVVTIGPEYLHLLPSSPPIPEAEFLPLDEIEPIYPEAVDPGLNRKNKTRAYRRSRGRPKLSQTRHICNLCDRRFLHRFSLVKHFEDRHPKDQRCFLCDTVYTSPEELLHHQETSHKAEYTCPKCHQNIYNALQFRLHVGNCQLEVIEENGMNTEDHDDDYDDDFDDEKEEHTDDDNKSLSNKRLLAFAGLVSPLDKMQDISTNLSRSPSSAEQAIKTDGPNLTIPADVENDSIPETTNKHPSPPLNKADISTLSAECRQQISLTGNVMPSKASHMTAERIFHLPVDFQQNVFSDEDDESGSVDVEDSEMSEDRLISVSVSSHADTKEDRDEPELNKSDGSMETQTGIDQNLQKRTETCPEAEVHHEDDEIKTNELLSTDAKTLS